MGIEIDERFIANYFQTLINSFFKILPIREQGEISLSTYMRSLQMELLGFDNLVYAIDYDSSYMTLLSILQYLIDNPDIPIPDVKREVFRAIRICNRLYDKHFGTSGKEDVLP